ncbi:MAG: S8 family serine peptidase [Euryarchaeota archaeon]|nr:S8 family serine peptidase [Euryarchaeota archaeon]
MNKAAAAVVVTLIVVASLAFALIATDDAEPANGRSSDGARGTDDSPDATGAGVIPGDTTAEEEGPGQGDAEPSSADDTSGGDQDPGPKAAPRPRDDDRPISFPAPRPLKGPVIAYIDTGINPYHAAFRDSARQAHPATYLDGYPASAEPLVLSLDAPDMRTALHQDEETWAAMEHGVLYYVPGTKIVGMVKFGDNPWSGGFIDANGHGTLVADAGSGNTAGVASESLIVSIQFTSDSDAIYDWIIASPWIDVVTTSVGIGHHGAAFFVKTGVGPDLSSDRSSVPGTYRLVDQGRLMVAAAGNDPTPSWRYEGGTPWIFSVGGARAQLIDGQQVWEVCKSCTRQTDVVAVMNGTFATHGSMTATVSASGTSVSGPRVAAYSVRLIEAARERLGDTKGFHDGAYATAPPGVPAPVRGPLSDGRFTVEDLDRLVRVAAVPFDVAENLSQVRWPTQGYGLFNDTALETALAILHGVVDEPERAWDDAWHTLYEEVSVRYWEPWVCRFEKPVTEWSTCPTGTEDPEGLAEAVRFPLPKP